MTTSVLSTVQEFYCSLDRGDVVGAFGRRYLLVSGWRVTGEVDVGALQGALDDLVVRHEILRTSVVRDAEPRYQRVHEPSPVTLRVRDLPPVAGKSRDILVEELLIEEETGTFDVRELPLLRAVLGRLDERDSVLVLVTHHSATDAWAMQLIMRDLAICYARRTVDDPPELPPMRQYREFATWQQTSAAGPQVAGARRYWREKLAGARIFALPNDRAGSEPTTRPYSLQVFSIDAEPMGAVLSFAREARATPFMVLLAALYVVAGELSGMTDLAISTITTGHNEARFHDTVGPFLNFLPIRTDISGCASFREIVARTRVSCVEAYCHEIPFGYVEPDAPDLMSPLADARLSPFTFEMVQSQVFAGAGQIGDGAREVRERVLPQPVAADIPDGVLWDMDLLPSGELVGNVLYNLDHFKEQRIIDLVANYRRVLLSSVAAPDTDDKNATSSPSTSR